MSRHARPARHHLHIRQARIWLTYLRARHFPHLLYWAVATVTGSAVLAGIVWAATPQLDLTTPAQAATGHPATTAARVCQPQEKWVTTARSGRYVLSNETMSKAAQCLTTTGRSQFTVAAEHPHGSRGVYAYPDLYYGCARRVCSPGTILPRRVSALPRLVTGWRYRFGNCLCNAAYDLWFSRKGGTGGHPAGPEMMIWLGTKGHVEANPATHGWHKVQVDGAWWWLLTWTTYDPTFGHWTYIQFCRVRKTTHAVLDLRPFMRTAERAGLLSARAYLRSVDAGFETWRGGRGNTTSWFKVTAKAAR